MKKILALSVLFLAILRVHAQQTQADMIHFLTNDNQRSWSFNDYRITLGASCSGQGQLFTFFKNGTVQWKKCVNDSLQFKVLNWKIEAVNKDNPNDFVLELNEGINVSQNGSLQELRIYFVSPDVHKKNIKMLWYVVPRFKGNEEATIDLLSMN